MMSGWTSRRIRVTASLSATLAFQKPVYRILPSTADPSDPTAVKRFFDECLLYGFYPGLSASSWKDPGLVERFRPLFKKYVPLVRRLAAAGWRPSPEAVCSNSAIAFERFGPDAHGTVYYAARNTTDRPQAADLALSGKLAGAGRGRVKDLLSGALVEAAERGLPIALPPGEMCLVEVRN